MRPSQKRLQKLTREAMLQRQLQAQHEVHGVIGEVFNRLGGIDRMVEWANTDTTTLGQFYRLLPKLAPSMLPTSGYQGEVEISVNPALQPTGLDIDGESQDITDYEDLEDPEDPEDEP